MFQWIRDKVKAAVLGGFQDALDELYGKAVPVEVPELRYEPEPEKKKGATRG